MRAVVCAVLLCAGVLDTIAGAQTPAAQPAGQTPAPQPVAAPEAASQKDTPSTSPSTSAAAPSDAEPQSPQLISEPPGADAQPAQPAAPASTAWDLPPALEGMLEELKVTDLAIALFALIVALFAFRLSSATSGLRAAVKRQAEANRRTIEASEKAADAARRAAEAAEQSLRTAREAADRQLRAYVTIRQFVQTPVKDERQAVHGWLLQVTWQNSGATPTKGFRYWAMLREFDGAIPEDFEFTPAGLKDFAGGELGSNASVSSPPLFVAPQLIAKLQDGSRKALLLGEADYNDVLTPDAKRATKFCVELVLVSDPNGANPPFSFAYFPKHNDIR